MEANELRIGNLIKQEAFFILERNTSSTNKKECADEQITVSKSNIIFIIDNIENYSGIPLTEEWFFKFGFEETEFVFRTGKFFLTKSISGKKMLYQAHQDRFSIKYVHQLQNLYFALTGEELKYEK